MKRLGFDPAMDFGKCEIILKTNSGMKGARDCLCACDLLCNTFKNQCGMKTLSALARQKTPFGCAITLKTSVG